MSGLPQRSVRSLADNEKQNRTLYDTSRRAVDAYRRREIEASHSPDGNLLGLGNVQLTNTAEVPRHDMDALATPANAGGQVLH